MTPQYLSVIAHQSRECDLSFFPLAMLVCRGLYGAPLFAAFLVLGLEGVGEGLLFLVHS